MTKPVLAILSRRSTLLGGLSERLSAICEPLLCDDPAEAQRLCRVRKPAAILLDFSDVHRGGDAEGRVLEALAANCPGVPLRVMTSDLCPEPLARRLAPLGLAPLSARLSAAELAEILTKLLHPDAPAAAASAPPAPSPRPTAIKTECRSTGSSVLEGISRRFETNTAPLAAMLTDLEIAARHDVTILLIGETGSGKTFLSRLIHEVSPRKDQPFLTVACGALPNDLIESELFGHVKGSFTGAHADKEGKFVAAGRGTVLLDEIDVLGPEQQVKLLRVIETGEFEPVGSNVTHRSAARLVVASNLNLQPLVEEGRFRPDLYYRLNMLKFDLLPLRRRKADIEPLARKFVEQLAKTHGVQITRVDRSFIEALLLYPWPGNVRELENVVRRAVIYSRDGALTSEQLPAHILSRQAGPTNDPSVRLHDTDRNLSMAAALEDDDEQSLGAQLALSERDIIEQTLFRNSFSRTNSAKDLGISRVTLYNKMKKYGMIRQATE